MVQTRPAMKALPLIGRILFAIPMLVFGYGHFTSAEAMAGMVPSFLPAPVFIVYLTGVILVGGGLGIVAGFRVRELGITVGLFLLSTAFLVWFPQLETAGQTAMSGFMKDLGLAGAAFFLAYFGAGPLSVADTKDKDDVA